MSDNEDAAAPLWYSKELSVKNAVGEPIPEFRQAPEKGAKYSSFVDRQDAGHVLPYQPSGPQSLSKPKELKREVATRVIQSLSESGDTESLTRCSSDQNVDWSMLILYFCEISQVGYTWPAVRE
jgi:hypothetical protein